MYVIVLSVVVCVIVAEKHLKHSVPPYSHVKRGAAIRGPDDSQAIAVWGDASMAGKIDPGHHRKEISRQTTGKRAPSVKVRKELHDQSA
jgi:hypothetical protein